MKVSAVKSWYEDSYLTSGFAAQRRYPNEELCRFISRRFSSVPAEERKNKNVLEVGCGSGANLWMIAAEGFNTFGVDLSAEGVALCDRMLREKGLRAQLIACDMTDTALEAESFDAIVDVFSSYCMNEDDYERFAKEVSRLLKPDGVFFSYTPSQRSDAFKNYEPSKLLDGSTLDGISRKDSPFTGNAYPFRFEALERLNLVWSRNGLDVERHERVGRTYRNEAEYFEFLVYEAVKGKTR